MAGANAGLAPGTIGRIGQSTYIHFFLLAWGWPGATLATLATLIILVILAILIILITPPLKATIFPLTIIIIIAKISYITAIFI